MKGTVPPSPPAPRWRFIGHGASAGQANVCPGSHAWPRRSRGRRLEGRGRGERGDLLAENVGSDGRDDQLSPLRSRALSHLELPAPPSGFNRGPWPDDSRPATNRPEIDQPGQCCCA